MLVKKQHRNGAYNPRVALTLVGIGACVLVAFIFMPGGNQAKARVRPQPNLQTGDSAMVTVRVFNQTGTLSEPVTMAKVVRTEEEWKKRLTPEQYRVTRNSGTEQAFCGNLLDNKKDGVYTCVCCQLPLFASNAKFNSGTGWPSFFQPICKENVTEKSDNAYGMVRVEINCARCDAHLGHVFEDGPPPTGLRYCINGVILDFAKAKDAEKQYNKEKPQR